MNIVSITLKSKWNNTYSKEINQANQLSKIKSDNIVLQVTMNPK